MDDKWFKAQQKKAGVTADDIAARMGRVRSTVSHIYSGRQKMSLEWAKIFSEVLKVPLAEVLERAGVANATEAEKLRPEFSNSDVIRWVAKGAEDRHVPAIASAIGQRPGIEVWIVKSLALSLMGYMPGDFVLVDTLAAERAHAGDTVIAEVHNNLNAGSAIVLRRFEPPVLVAASTDPDDRRVYIVDGVNVVIKGKIVASWRT